MSLGMTLKLKIKFKILTREIKHMNPILLNTRKWKGYNWLRGNTHMIWRWKTTPCLNCRIQTNSWRKSWLALKGYVVVMKDRDWL